MTILPHYHHFAGVYWESASLRHALAYQGIKMPHTQQPISEALLFGISGGAAIGYFSFAYEGVDPHVALLIRNTFDPVEHMCERLGIVQTVKQTTSVEKGLKNVTEALEQGQPAIVWADLFTLPYNAQADALQNWAMMPIVVYGLDGDTAYIADRAGVSLEIPTAVLTAARTRTKDNKNRMMTVDLPDTEKLAKAVTKGIHACISLYTDTPPRGPKSAFGFDSLKKWAELLVKARDKASWAKVFPRGRAYYAGLTSAFSSIEIFGTEGGASRGHYADFLDEASAILDKPTLRQAAELFRQTIPGWHTLAHTLLPDEVPPFCEARKLMLRKKTLFEQQGMAALDDMQAIERRLAALRDEMTAQFPLNEAETAAHSERIREQVLRVHDLELAAVNALEDVMR